MPTIKKQCPTCPNQMHHNAKRCIVCEVNARRGKATGEGGAIVSAPTPPQTPAEVLAENRIITRQRTEITNLKLAYKESLATIEQLEVQQGIVNQMHANVDAFEIPQYRTNHENEGTIVVVASDWHVEEAVGPEVGGLNTYSLEIAHTRAVRFFQATARLTQLLQQDIAIPTIVLALLGDFISGAIHDEVAELAEVAPMHAIVTAQNMIISGIEYLLKTTSCNLVIPCHSGNHARTTKQTHFSAENGHSLEYLMYLHLQAYFRAEPRITFLVSVPYHSYMNIYGTTVRFHHGHAVKYNGGVGGLTIPVNKAIAQWNRAKKADLDVFGHFHQRFDGGNFIANGSLIGYNGFAVAIKASYEPPAQQMFLMDRKRQCKTCVWPILMN